MLAMRPQSSTPASGAAGTAQVDRLLHQLEQNLENAKLSLKQAEHGLRQVKVLGRSVHNAGPIFTKRGVSILSRYGLDQESSNTSREALRCLANAFLLDEPSRQTFVDLGYAPRAAERLKNDDREDEFLLSRILFLLTYNTKIDFEVLLNDNKLADSINQQIVRHAKNFSRSGRRKSINSPSQDMAMVETLKLLFNITYYYPDLASRFTPSVEPLINIILHHPLPSPPLQPPITYLLNALLNLDLNAAEKKTPYGREARVSPLFPYSHPETVVDRLSCILDEAIRKQQERELDQAAAPLVTLIRRMYELATPQMKSWMRWLLLPTSKDRDKPLGQGETLSARLLRLSCSPNLPTLRENVSSLLFELSDKDASKFVNNIGYGFAAGFLMSHNIQIPANAMEASSTASEESNRGVEFNPVTGQRWSSEDHDAPKTVPEMTEEEKEREAERLFVLFERLKATGVVDIKNPVEQAIDDGRFEELD
ncbi:Synembryn-like protein [Fulvia fulva]|uniref:Synembryn-like protein n=1 Tax=Passalora fulva TaxID=5499 RepID=A0A9Q8L5T5_PASFU|nr:Synembryn-like protein [Fulvia fulva]KAK4635065.1 Synembryn-like protein [Fulvia fulva]KAK4638368.1 Synembryn-like protein [Fulvia fulva]UJO11351.1 Synembryn-like protein [Fulvia fulva]WPV09940.1 Synembryn-like protein [Fulvia fulva]WPV23221.1 Synembryn-like protein [Fulvia fulva]